MGNSNNPAAVGPVVESQEVKQKVTVHQSQLRPLPQCDRNEMHCVMQPVYAKDQVIIQQSGDSGYHTNAVLVPQANGGLVRDHGQVVHQVKIKEKIKQTDVI